LQKFLLPLDDFIAEDGMDLTALFGQDAALSIGGKVLGLPARNAPNVFAYRRDLYADAGFEPPTTVEEWVAQVPKLTKKGDNGRIDIFGTSIAEGASAPHFSTVMIAYVLFPYGLRILSPDLTGPDPGLIGDTAVSLLTALQAMAANGDTPNQLAWSYTDNITAWQQGQIANSSLYAARSQAIEDKTASKVAGKVGYTLSPGVPTAGGKIAAPGPYKPVYFGGPWYLTVNAKTTNPRAAWELLKFLAASEEGQKQMALKNNNQPTLLSVLRSPEYKAKDPAADVALKIYENYGWSAIAPVPQNADIELAIHQEVQQLFTGKAPKQVAQGIYDGIGKFFKA
jgi:multiple sugar transport system substrate-binding protein